VSRARDLLVDIPGGSIFVRRWTAAAGEGDPIFLLHDSLGSVEQWREFPAALAAAAGREIIAYDRLGFGRSTARNAPPCVDFIEEEAAELFPALRRALAVTHFALLGHSVGGAMALVAAAGAAQQCEAVVTEAAQAFVEPRTLAGIRAARAQFEDPAQFARLSRWHGDKARWVLNAWTEVWLSAQFACWSLDRELPAVRCPVLAIHGDRDEFGSEEFPRRIAAKVGGRAELKILERCGHVPHRERSAEVVQLTAAFLQRHAGAPTMSDS